MRTKMTIIAAISLGAVLFSGSAIAFEDLTRKYAAQLRAAQSDKLPASYRIIKNNAQAPANAQSRYLGGEIRVIYLDGRAMRMPESVIVENIRTGHFVPVYQETGQPLSKEDWLVSLPSWLGYKTVAAATP